MNKARIMIVEDEDYIVELLKASLVEMGYSIIAHSNSGKKSIALATQLRPDIILMDIQLKGPMNGIEAADIIQTYLNIPIIFLTAHDDDDKLEQAKIAKPFGYLLKPFRARELRIAIDLAIYRNAIEFADRTKLQAITKMCRVLRTPATAIINACHELEVDASLLNDAQLKSLESILRNGKDILSMINEILEQVEHKT